MWRSEADIMKDLITLDDFGVSKADESYKVLYSFGRGIKTREEPKLSNSFIDPRTGDIINLDEFLEPSDICKSKGRGSVLSNFSRSKYQLQKQLRMARPLGSSDDPIEAFCRRNRPVKQEENFKNSSQSESDNLTSTIPDDASCSNPHSLIENVRPKVKATRNSKLQHNVLISNLLSKGVNASSSNSVEKENFEKNNGIGGNNDDADDGRDEYDKDNSIKESGFDVIYSSNETAESETSSNRRTNNLNESYKTLAERIKKSNENHNKKDIYDFGDCLEHITSITKYPFKETEQFQESSHFIFNSKDFPALKRIMPS